MSRLSTLQKAKKIIGCCDQIEPRKLCVQPYLRSGQKKRRQYSFSSGTKSMSNMKRDFSFCKSKNKLENSMQASNSCLKDKKKINDSFVSAYNKETRYDRIMRLKVKPTFDKMDREIRNKQSVLSSSMSSCSSRDNKQNKSRNKLNRFEKIMQIKVAKPKVNSTLIYYEPKQGNKQSIIERRESAVKEWKQCQTKIKKIKQQQQKEDRLWHVFERERELRVKLRKQTEERADKQQRRKQQRFENIVSKQVHKIQRQRELSKRKSEGFSNYLYPFY